MQSSPDDASFPAADAADLTALFVHVKTAERALCQVVRLAGRLSGSGVAERVEGGALDWIISMACRWTGADARTVVAAGETLRDLPTVDRLFAQGLVSWGQVRRITFAARRLSVAQRGELDARFAAAVEQYGCIDAFDPDHLCDAVDAAAQELRGERALQRQERVAGRDNFLAIQGRIDGGITMYGSADAIGGAPIVNAIAAARPVPQSPDDDRDPGAATRQGRQQFDALHEICAEFLAGTNSGLLPDDDDVDGDADGDDCEDREDGGIQADGGEETGEAGGQGATRHPRLQAAVRPARRRRNAKYLIHMLFDTSQASISPTGVIELNVPGALPRISAAALEILARDADFQAVLLDGKRPLATSAKLYAKDVPADVRFAVRARDGGDRWPGSRAPIGWTEPHHIVWRRHSGTNHPDKLVSLTRGPHTWVHNHGWQLTLDPATGMLTVKRRHRTFRSLPRTTGLPPPPDRPDPPPDVPSQHTGGEPPEPLPF